VLAVILNYSMLKTIPFYMPVTFPLLRTHSIDNNVLILCYRGHTDAVLCVQFDKEKVVSGSKDTTIKVLRAVISCLVLVSMHENTCH